MKEKEINIIRKEIKWNKYKYKKMKIKWRK